MTTRTESEVKIFSDAINQCKRPILLVSSDGTHYNMKNAEQFNAGMEKWGEDTNDDMEIFASTYEDEAVMMCFWQRMHAA